MDSSNKNTEQAASFESQISYAQAEAEAKGGEAAVAAADSDSDPSTDSSNFTEDALSNTVEEDSEDDDTATEPRFSNILTAIQDHSLQNTSLLFLEFWRDTTEWRRNLLSVTRFCLGPMDLEQPPAPLKEINQMIRLSHCETHPKSGRIIYQQLCSALCHGGSMAHVLLDDLGGNRILRYNPESSDVHLSARLQYSRRSMGAGIIGGNFLYVAGGERSGHESKIVNRFDFSRDSWTHLVEPLPERMEIHHSAVVHGRLLVLGRTIPRSRLVCMGYSPSTNSWEQYDSILDPCFHRMEIRFPPYAIPMTLQGPENGNGDILFRLVRLTRAIVQVQMCRVSSTNMQFSPWQTVSTVRNEMDVEVFNEDFFVRGVSETGSCFVMLRYRGSPCKDDYPTKLVAAEFHSPNCSATVMLREFELEGKEDHVVLPFTVNC